MSSLVEMKVSGLDALQAQLVALGTELGIKALAQAARKAFLPVIDAARALVPKYSGALAAAIKISVAKPRAGDGVVVVGLYIGAGPKDSAGGALLGRAELPPARRWHLIELGTSKLAAHPYIRPAFESNVAGILSGLKAELQISITKALQKRV